MKLYFILIFSFCVVLDQLIKFFFISGFSFSGSCISLSLVYNFGVAFSMFSFFGAYLKYLQIVLLIASALYVYYNANLFYLYHRQIAMIAAGAVSNIIDRFLHGGVVDYIFWHCLFEFAIFNLADILINIGFAWIVYQYYLKPKFKNHIAE